MCRIKVRQKPELFSGCICKYKNIAINMQITAVTFGLVESTSKCNKK